MSPEKQRIAIAEACEWKVEKLWNGELHGKPIGEQGPFRDVPDYLNDLNACHEFEEMIFDMYDPQSDIWVWAAYCDALVSVMFPESDEDEENAEKLLGYTIMAIRATAAQRCEAFLKTLNLWED